MSPALYPTPRCAGQAKDRKTARSMGHAPILLLSAQSAQRHWGCPQIDKRRCAETSRRRRTTDKCSATGCRRPVLLNRHWLMGGCEKTSVIIPSRPALSPAKVANSAAERQGHEPCEAKALWMLPSIGIWWSRTEALDWPGMRDAPGCACPNVKGTAQPHCSTATCQQPACADIAFHGANFPKTALFRAHGHHYRV